MKFPTALRDLFRAAFKQELTGLNDLRRLRDLGKNSLGQIKRDKITELLATVGLAAFADRYLDDDFTSNGRPPQAATTGTAQLPWLREKLDALRQAHGTVEPAVARTRLAEASSAVRQYRPTLEVIQRGLLTVDERRSGRPDDAVASIAQVRRAVAGTLLMSSGSDGPRRCQIFEALIGAMARSPGVDGSWPTAGMPAPGLTGEALHALYTERGAQPHLPYDFDSSRPPAAADFDSIATAIDAQLRSHAADRQGHEGSLDALDVAYVGHVAAEILSLNAGYVARPGSLTLAEIDRVQAIVDRRWHSLGSWQGPLNPAMAVLNGFRQLVSAPPT